jgi:hypothetical protein
MKLARGLALSKGQASLTQDVFNLAWTLDEQRVARSAETAPKATADLLGQQDGSQSVKETGEESEDELEIEGGPPGGAGFGAKKMVGR